MHKVVFVGLSNKIDKEPFDLSTPAGKVICQIEQRLGSDYQIFKCNLVPYAPVTKEGKLRYPTKEECKQSYPKLLLWCKRIKPDCIVFLGKQVESSIQVNDFKESKVLFFPHPSYIWTYKRKNLESYILEIVNSISQINK